MRLESTYGNCSFPATLKSLWTTHLWHVLVLVTRNFSFTKFRNCRTCFLAFFQMWHYLNFGKLYRSKHIRWCQVKDCPKGAARSLWEPITDLSCNLWVTCLSLEAHGLTLSSTNTFQNSLSNYQHIEMNSNYWKWVLENNREVETRSFWYFL